MFLFYSCSSPSFVLYLHETTSTKQQGCVYSCNDICLFVFESRVITPCLDVIVLVLYSNLLVVRSVPVVLQMVALFLTLTHPVSLGFLEELPSLPKRTDRPFHSEIYQEI